MYSTRNHASDMCLFLTRVFIWIKSSILRDMTPCSPIYVHGVFRGMCCLHLQCRRVSKARSKQNTGSRNCPGVGGPSTECCSRRDYDHSARGRCDMKNIWVLSNGHQSEEGKGIHDQRAIVISFTRIIIGWLRLEWTGKRLAPCFGGFMCENIERL
jgi:hypothetical protein